MVLGRINSLYHVSMNFPLSICGWLSIYVTYWPISLTYPLPISYVSAQLSSSFPFLISSIPNPMLITGLSLSRPFSRVYLRNSLLETSLLHLFKPSHGRPTFRPVSMSCISYIAHCLMYLNQNWSGARVDAFFCWNFTNRYSTWVWRQRTTET